MRPPKRCAETPPAPRETLGAARPDNSRAPSEQKARLLRTTGAALPHEKQQTDNEQAYIPFGTSSPGTPRNKIHHSKEIFLPNVLPIQK